MSEQLLRLAASINSLQYTAHAGMRVNRAVFNALVEDFQVAMDKHNAPFSSQNKLLAKLAPMYRDIETTSGAAIAPANMTSAN